MLTAVPMAWVKRSPEREQRVLQALRNGNTRTAAARCAGIEIHTLERWAKRSAQFAQALSRAEAESQVALVAIVRQAAASDWRAAAHLLERRWPDEWGRREKIDIDVYARQRARELGIDEHEAVQAVRPACASSHRRCSADACLADPCCDRPWLRSNSPVFDSRLLDTPRLDAENSGAAPLTAGVVRVWIDQHLISAQRARGNHFCSSRWRMLGPPHVTRPACHQGNDLAPARRFLVASESP